MYVEIGKLFIIPYFPIFLNFSFTFFLFSLSLIRCGVNNPLKWSDHPKIIVPVYIYIAYPRRTGRTRRPAISDVGLERRSGERFPTKSEIKSINSRCYDRALGLKPPHAPALTSIARIRARPSLGPRRRRSCRSSFQRAGLYCDALILLEFLKCFDDSESYFREMRIRKCAEKYCVLKRKESSRCWLLKILHTRQTNQW